MDGYSVGTLSVYYNIKFLNGSVLRAPSPVWRDSKNHGDYWMHGQVQYQGGNSSIASFMLEGTAGIESNGNIALDDIAIKDGDCVDPNFFSLKCDFEAPQICGYKFDVFTRFNWTRSRGLSYSSSPSPATDVTTGTKNGYYMYAQMTSRSQGDIARLVSPPQSFQTGKCLVFWYQTNVTSSSSRLNVLAELQMNQMPNPNTTLLALEGQSYGNDWYIARVPTEFVNDFRIVFEGITGDKETGYIVN